MQLNETSFTATANLADGSTLRGTFKVKLRLSYRDVLRMDSIRRDLLGKSPEMADGAASVIAERFAKMWVHILEAPSWWKDAGNGIDFEDAAPINEVFNAIEKLEKEHYEEMKAKAESAKEELKKNLPEQK